MEAAQKALRKNGLVAVQSEQPVPKGKGKRKASEGDAAGSGASSSTGGHASAKPEDAEASSSACGAPAKRLRTKQAPAEPVCIGEAAPSAHALANDAPEALLEQDLNPEGQEGCFGRLRISGGCQPSWPASAWKAALFQVLLHSDSACQSRRRHVYRVCPLQPCLLCEEANIAKHLDPWCSHPFGKGRRRDVCERSCGQGPRDDVSKGVTISWHGEPSASWKAAQVVAGWVPPTPLERDEEDIA